MNIHNWKNKELNRLLMEKFGLGKESDTEELEEGGEKPDFLDLDKDGDKKEPMKSAAAEEEEDLDEGKGHPGEPLEAKDHPGECADAHPDLGHEEWASQNLEEAVATDEDLEERKKRDDPRNYVGRPGHVRNPSN